MVSEGRVLDCVCALSCLLWNFSSLCWMIPLLLDGCAIQPSAVLI
jgi:hypothetical protein